MRMCVVSLSVLYVGRTEERNDECLILLLPVSLSVYTFIRNLFSIYCVSFIRINQKTRSILFSALFYTLILTFSVMPCFRTLRC